jgi:hypothetical protein
MKKFEINCTFMDSGTKRTGIMTIEANSSSEASNKIMETLKKLGATNIAIISVNQAK